MVGRIDCVVIEEGFTDVINTQLHLDFLINKFRSEIKNYSKDKYLGMFGSFSPNFCVNVQRTDWMDTWFIIPISISGEMLVNLQITVELYNKSTGARLSQTSNGMPYPVLYQGTKYYAVSFVGDDKFRRALGLEVNGSVNGFIKRFTVDLGFTTTDEIEGGFVELISSWQKAYLNDKKMNALSVGKTFQFVKIKNADGTPHTGGETETFSIDRGGLTATGFRTNTAEGLFLERSNELLSGTFVIGGLTTLGGAGNYLKNIQNIVNNATNPLSGLSSGGSAYVRNINENLTNVSKIISQGNVWTGTIIKARSFVSAVGSGSPGSMSLMKAMGFGTLMGVAVITGVKLGNIVVDKVKEYITPQGTYQLTKYANLVDLYNTADYVDELMEKAEQNAKKENEKNANANTDSGTNSAEQLDEWEKQQAEAQAKADAEAKEKAEAEKAAIELANETLKGELMQTAKDYLSQIKGILDFQYNNVDKKQDILDVEHEEATTLEEGKNKAQRNVTAWKNLHSLEEGTHTDVQGNAQVYASGLVGILKSFAPATLNEYLTRITGKNMADEWNLEDVKERLENVLGTFITLFNIKEEDIPSLDTEGLSDFDKEAIQWYNALKDKKNLTEDVNPDEGVV